jgi:hypothetical protein
MFERMLKLEKKHNEEWDDEGMKPICIVYNKEDHTTHYYFISGIPE